MRRKRISIYLNFLIAFALIFSVLVGSFGSAMAKSDKPLAIDLDFLTLVQENPDDTFMVIVQKDAKNKDLKDMELEDLVNLGGGRVRKQLDMIVSFSAEMTGKEVEKIAKNPKVRWVSPDAPVVSTGAMGLNTMLDTFEWEDYYGDFGTNDWDGGWVEVGDAGWWPEGDGSIRLATGDGCEGAAGYCLGINPKSMDHQGIYVYRQADLRKAASATLSFYRNNQLNGADGTIEEVKVEISSDGGYTWTTLQTYNATTFLGVGEDSFNITPHLSATTQVRFLISQIERGDRNIFFDNIKIEYADPSPFRSVVGADNLWQDGQGVTVAVIDSGISDHPDLHQSSNNVSQALNSPSRVIASAVVGAYASPEDEYAHGTHVAGIIAGNGVYSDKNEYIGVAPGANLVNVRVSNDQGMTYTSDVVDGMQWVYDNKDTYNIRVLNMSVNSTVPESYHNNPMTAAAEILWFNGITVVVAAGNNGTADGPSTIYPPANDPFVITVGAIEDQGTIPLDDDFVGEFSAYGTTEDGFAKPDLVAPGRNLVSLLAGTDATAYINHPKHQVDDYYFRMSGTSMSAPVVSGVIALVLQENPDLNPDQVKYRLMYTANQTWAGYDATKAGAGTVNAYYAVYKATTGYANQGITPSYMLTTGDDAVAFDSVGWNSVGWNSVGWNSVGWNSVGWNSVGWNSVGWNSVGWNSVGWNTSTWDE